MLPVCVRLLPAVLPCRRMQESGLTPDQPATHGHSCQLSSCLAQASHQACIREGMLGMPRLVYRDMSCALSVEGPVDKPRCRSRSPGIQSDSAVIPAWRFVSRSRVLQMGLPTTLDDLNLAHAVLESKCTIVSLSS